MFYFTFSYSFADYLFSTETEKGGIQMAGKVRGGVGEVKGGKTMIKTECVRKKKSSRKIKKKKTKSKQQEIKYFEFEIYSHCVSFIFLAFTHVGIC